MIKNILRFVLILILFISTVSFPQIAERVGWWNFNDTTHVLNPVSGYGLPLQLVGTHQISEGPTSGDYAVKIGVGSHYKMKHQITANGGGTKVNEYSLQVDFKIPSISVWHCFFQTTMANNNDGDCFINTSGNIGVGVTGYSTYGVHTNEWYRLVVSIKNGTQYKYYLDGQLINSGTPQSVDGRFALDSLLLMFADEDGEDNEIYVSEIGIWNKALTGSEVQNLGGFGHSIGTVPGTQLILVPYLQMPSPTSIWICWHDTLSTITNVEYGLTTALGQSANGTSEIVADPYRWHSVKLTGLQPNTEYFYKAVSGSGSSNIYSFRTLPDSNYNGKIRFLLLSDTHCPDTTWAVKVIKQAKLKMQELYWNDIQNQVNLVMHSGDLVVSGNTIMQWTDEYFAPMSYISPNIPFMTITGNHEGETPYYYKYMHYNEISPIPAANEKFWSLRVANTVFVGLNSNTISNFGTLQQVWLDNFLTSVENDTSIDFVFVMSHHFSVTELWGEGMTYDAGPGWVTNQLYPTLKKYSKVVQHSYGHTHGYERGTVETIDPDARGDFRIVCGGGGGGATDRWGVYVNNDFPQVHITLDNYFYQLIEIDAANKTYVSKMFSLGNSDLARDNELMDTWYRKQNQSKPETPVTYVPNVQNDHITFSTSAYAGVDSLMSVRIQVSSDANFNTTVLDTMVHWKDVYGVTAQFIPIDLNAGIDLTHLSINSSRLISGNTYHYRVKYRDHNTKWSDWSNSTTFNNLVSVDETQVPFEYRLDQNFPNPFNPATRINFGIKESGNVLVKVYDVLGNEVATLLNKEMIAGNYSLTFNAGNLTSGVYFYKIITGNFSDVKKMLLIK